MLLIDSHTHLYSEQFQEDQTSMINKAIEAGIQKFFLPNIDSTSLKGMNELVGRFPENCYAMIGLHPCSVKEDFEKELQVVEREISRSKHYIAIGEIGLDLYWDKSFQKEQEFVFRRQIEWAKEQQLPIVIHCREAFDEILSILDEVNDHRLSGVFHCFTGTIEQARHILDYGSFKLGIGGVVTYKNSGLDNVVKELSVDDIILETDAPYLAPSPYRGKRNESSYLIEIAQKVSDLFNITIDELAQRTTTNALSIFTING